MLIENMNAVMGGHALFIGIFLFFILHACLSQHVSIQSFRYKKYSDGGQRGVSPCVIYQNHRSRSLVYNRETEVCQPLDSTWFVNPIYESGLTYLSQTMVEHRFDTSSMTVYSDIPPNIVLGSNIDLYLKSPADGGLHGFRINVMDKGLSKIYFHMNLRPYSSKVVVFNTLINNWGIEEIKFENPFRSADTVYKISFKLGISNIQVMVNDNSFHSYRYRSPISTYRVLKYKGYKEHCQRIVYTAP